MTLSRRQFLATTTAAGAVLAARPAPSAAKPARPPKPRPLALDDWASVRALFDLDPRYTHLALFYIASHPRPVREAIEEFRARLDANPFLTVERAMFDFEHPGTSLATRAAGAIGKYIGASGDDVALTGNTTTGLALIYLGFPLRPDDEVLTTAHDHFVHHEAIRLATERAGATWRKIALFDSYAALSPDEIVARIEKAIRPSTRIVGVTWVHSASGVKLPIRRIADAIARVNGTRAPDRQVRLVVDGVHGIGVERPDIPGLGCDAFAAGTHKWIFGPRGTGFAWAKPELWASMRPLIPSFTAPDVYEAWMAEKPPGKPRARCFTPGGFQSYEHYWATPVAIELHQKIGPARITERIHALNTMAKDGLAKMPHVTLYTPRDPELSAGIVCFDVKGMQPEAVAQKLLEKNVIASTTPYRVTYARLAFGVPNNEADVEIGLRAIHALG